LTGSLSGSYTFLRIAEEFHKRNFSTIEAFLAELVPMVPMAIISSSLPFIYLGFEGIKDMLSEKLRRKRGD
jgi:hypothetical protein